MERHSAFHLDGQPLLDLHGTPRQLEILDLLNRYDLLPSTYIRAQIPRFYCNDTLTLLVKGHYIGLHPEARNQLNARAKPYVYQLLSRGRAMLALNGRAIKPRGNDHYKHMLLRSQIEFLCDQLPFDIRSPEYILNHPRCPEATKLDPYPWRIPPKPALEPDITRGFARDGRTFFVHIEVDRNTEPLTSRNADRQSLLDKIRRYDGYLANQIYKERYGIAAPTILLLTTAEHRKEALKNLVETHAPYRPDRFAFLCVPPDPPPTLDISEWETTTGTLNLMEKLSAPRHENSEGRRTHRPAPQDRPRA